MPNPAPLTLPRTTAALAAEWHHAELRGAVVTAAHATDADCTVDPATDTCACGVVHGDPCRDCGGRGFHRAGCPTMVTATTAGPWIACTACGAEHRPIVTAGQYVGTGELDELGGCDRDADGWICGECGAVMSERDVARAIEAMGDAD